MNIVRIYHNDRNVSIAEFKDSTNLVVIDISEPTVQGEGKYAGTPALFIRLAGCHRGNKLSAGGCHFCDSDFSLENPKTKTYSYEELGEIVKNKIIQNNLKHLVITGGEPFLQPRGLIKFIHNLGGILPYLITIDIENTGEYFTWEIYQKINYVYFGKVNIVISPKMWLKSTKNIEKDLYEVEYLKNHVDKPPKFIKQNKLSKSNYIRTELTLKLLIEDVKDSPYCVLPNWLNDWRSLDLGDIYLSPIMPRINAPENNISSIWDGDINVVQAKKNCSLAAKLAIENQCKVSVQTHLMLNVY